MGGHPEVDVNMGGWQGYQETVLGAGVDAWSTQDFAGNFSQADLDGLQVNYRADTSNKDATNNIDVVYVIITYTLLAVGYSHDFMGVPAANIDNVCGVPTANIDKIKGV